MGSTAEAGSVVLIKLDILPQYHPEVVLLDIYRKEPESHIRTKACTQPFIVALLIIDKT